MNTSGRSSPQKGRGIFPTEPADRVVFGTAKVADDDLATELSRSCAEPQGSAVFWTSQRLEPVAWEHQTSVSCLRSVGCWETGALQVSPVAWSRWFPECPASRQQCSSIRFFTTFVEVPCTSRVMTREAAAGHLVTGRPKRTRRRCFCHDSPRKPT